MSSQGFAHCTVHHTLYPAIDPTRPELSMKGKTIVVTGGGHGIGSAAAKAFAQAGASSIAIIGRTESALRQTKAAMNTSYGVNIQLFTADVTDAERIQYVFSRIRETVGSVDVLVNNAGFLADSTMAKDAEIKDWWRAFEVNVKGSYVVTQAFLRNAGPDPVLLNVSSAVAHYPDVYAGTTSYVGSKAAFTRVVDVIQVENPQLRTVNIMPGMIKTNLVKKAGMWDMDLPWDDGVYSSARCIVMMRANTCAVEVPAGFFVWASSDEGSCLKGKFVWANWDVDELRKKLETANEHDLKLGLIGWL
jgi:NAD(P)-dependent dehydrogenase (short-subunit alcohol dehydrogenase family)